jgi:ribosomal protein S18 acetylase RimI-like enzyme
MDIQNAILEDIDTIFKLYRMASDYQRSKKHVVVWPEFKRELVETELQEQRQFKLIIDGEIACVWAITFSDAQIWEARNADTAVYIHRIATNPKFRGHNFVGHIVTWAKTFAMEQQLDYIRLDTIGDNTRLIKHYTNAGFDFLGMFQLKNTDTLPDHYHTAPACLFEIDLRN